MEKPSPDRGERLSRLKNLSPLPGLGFAQTETTAFSRGYILTPLRGSFRLIVFSLTKAIRLTRSGGQQRNGPGSDPPHLFFGVRDVDKREAQARVQIENLPAEFILKFIVQIRKRLVHQYCQRLCYESACDGDTLLLAAGQPCGIGIFETIQAHASQHFRNALWRTFASSGCAFRAKSRFS